MRRILTIKTSSSSLSPEAERPVAAQKQNFILSQPVTFEITDQIKPVLINLQIPEDGKVIMQALNTEFDNPVMHGGALRDTFRKAAYADIDIRAGLRREFSPASLNVEDVHNDNFDWQDQVIEKINSIPGMNIIKHTQCFSYGHEDGAAIDAERFQVIFSHNGKDIKADITITDYLPDAFSIALGGDAPINSIATDLSGDVWAHPQFLSDMKEKLYRVLRTHPSEVRASVERFGNISQRFKGLELL